jgi:hypothetical protein
MRLMPPRPRLQAAAPRRAAGQLAALAPATALILGLGAVAAIVASKPGLSPSMLRGADSATWDLYPVGGRPEVYQAPPISPFSDAFAHRPWVLTLGLTIIYLSSTTAIGSIVVRELRGNDTWPRPLSAIAGFLPGYLMVLAPLQLLYAAVSLQTASWIAITALPIAAVALHRHALAASATSALHDRRALRTLTFTASGVAAMVALAMVHRLQAGQFFLTQDSIFWLLAAGVRQLRDGLGPYLLQWTQQSDEWVFNAPLMFTSHNIGDLWFPVYATQCVSVASFLALVFGIVHRLARHRKNLAAAVTTAAVFGSTLAIYPWLYVTIVAGGQPLVQLGHPGRHIGIIAPWIALLLLRPHRPSTTTALAFATLGLGFVSLHVLLDVLAAISAALIWRTMRGHAVAWMDVRGFRVGMCILPVIALGAMACAFWWLGKEPASASAAWWLVIGTIIATAGAFGIGAATPRLSTPATPEHAPAWIAAWLAALVGGLLLSNNLTDSLFHIQTRTLLGTVLPGYAGPPLIRGGLNGLGDGVVHGLSFPSLSDPACGAFIQCGGLANFLAAFGVLFVLVLVVWISLGPLTADAALNVRRFALLIMVAGLGLGLLIVFFTGAPTVAAVLIYSRFLEVPYYGLLALAALTFAESRNRVTAITGTSMLILWTVIPLIATHWPEQMLRNTGWYLQRIF